MVEDVTVKSVVVLGTVRNVTKTLRQTVSSIVQSCHPIPVAGWIIVESDSNDSTLAELESLRKEIPGFEYLSLGNLKGEIPERISRIRHCREEARIQFTRRAYSNLTRVIVADFDGVCDSLEHGGISRSMSTLEEADVICANSRGPYYDILALRKVGWVEMDYRDLESQFLDSGFSRSASKYLSLVSKQVKISPSLPAIEVDSAFGGLALYRPALLETATYLTDRKNESECEHVTLNRAIRQNGGVIVIDPALRVRPEIRHTVWARAILLPLWLLIGKSPMPMLKSRRDAKRAIL